MSQIQSINEELNRISAKSGSMSGESRQEDFSQIELFDALGHPLRVKIVETLNASPLSFSDLKRKVGVDSSGHLTFHLNKLGNLVNVNTDGNYCLTDNGKEALRLLYAIGEARRQAYHAPTTSKEWWKQNKKVLMAMITVLIIVSLGICTFTLYSGVENQRYVQASEFHEAAFYTYGNLMASLDQLQNGYPEDAVWLMGWAALRMDDIYNNYKGVSNDFSQFLIATQNDRSVIALKLRLISARFVDGSYSDQDIEFIIDVANANYLLYLSLPEYYPPLAFLEQYRIANLTTNVENFHLLWEEAMAIDTD